MFTAVYDQDTPQYVGAYVKFDRFLLNIGNSFDLNTGTFTSPIDGVYQFTFHGTVWNVGAGIQVWQNEDLKLTFHGGNGLATGYDAFGNNWLLSMRKGDTLKLKISGNGQIISDENNNTVFTGKFIGII